MNFAARTSRPRIVARLRPRVLGVTVGALVAVPFGAAPAGPAPADIVLAGPAPIAIPAVAAPTPALVPSPATVTATVMGPAPIPSLAPPPAPIPSLAPVPSLATPPAPDRSTLARSEPTRLRIPAIAVDSALVGLGLQDDGRMEVPPGAFPAGWYTGAPTPGELGPAILAGHVDHSGSAGVFSRLRELAPGDRVEVVRADGSTAVFRVTRVEQHAKDAFPTAAVYGDIDHAGLRLITCGGAFDRSARSYEDNIVVFAELAAST